jgi:restriction system protein
MANDKQLSRSRSLAAKLIYAALSILRDYGKEMPMRDVMSRVAQQVDLNDWDKQRYEKSGYVRWESILHFFSIDCVKAGYLIKKKGVWYLTPEGEEALVNGLLKVSHFRS